MSDAGGISRRNGLRVDRAKTQAWQRDSARRYAIRRASRSSARLTSRISRPRRNDWPPKVRALAVKRSDGLCELDGIKPATHLHHRKLRRHGDHRIVNALHVCDEHHRMIHAAPSWSYTRGLLVKADRDPADVPVLIDVDTRVLLTLSGDYREAA